MGMLGHLSPISTLRQPQIIWAVKIGMWSLLSKWCSTKHLSKTLNLSHLRLSPRTVLTNFKIVTMRLMRRWSKRKRDSKRGILGAISIGGAASQSMSTLTRKDPSFSKRSNRKKIIKRLSLRGEHARLRPRDTKCSSQYARSLTRKSKSNDLSSFALISVTSEIRAFLGTVATLLKISYLVAQTWVK
jgi:hypothetical protein